MKTLFYLFAATFLLTSFLAAQVRTGEKTIIVDKVTGDTTYTESIIISESEDITPRNSMIIINPLKFIVFYNISYYHKISKSTVLGIGIQTPTFDGLTGIGLNAEVRFHPTGKNMRGFYVAPNISFNSISSEGGDDSENIITIGGLLGWQWFPGDQFAMGLGIGVDYYSGVTSDDDFPEGFAPALRFDIGYAW